MRPDPKRRARSRSLAVTAAVVALAFCSVFGSVSTAATPTPDAAEGGPATPAPAADTSGSVLAAADNPFDLSDEQQARIDEIVAQSGVRAQQLKRDLADARADLKQSLDAPEPDFDEVMQGVDRVGQLEIDLRKHQIATLMSVRALLTDDQRAVLIRFLEAASAQEQKQAAAAGEGDDREPRLPDHITSEIPAAVEAAATR